MTAKKLIKAKRRINGKSLEELSVILPRNPFTPEEARNSRYCLCAIDVVDLMKWWPGEPHQPEIHAEKVRAIQRSLDWKRVAEIAAYLMQEEIFDVPEKLVKYFQPIYEPDKDVLGREWPPKVKKIIKPVPSSYPTFSNVLIHINGASLNKENADGRIGKLTFDVNSTDLDFSIAPDSQSTLKIDSVSATIIFRSTQMNR